MGSNNEHTTLRRRVTRTLGRTVSDAAWQLAIDRRFVADATSSSHREQGERELVEFLRDVLAVSDAGVRASRPRAAGAVAASDLTGRVEAVSRLAAEHAAGDGEVLRYRRDVLHRDAPMSPEEAEVYLDAPKARAARAGRSGSGRGARLRYQNRRMDHDIPIEDGSPLDELRLLADRLCDSYPWQPAQAAAFVLEGLIPLATPFVLRLPYRPHEDRPWRARILMEVDLWMPAEAVLKAYRQAQRRVLPGHNRPISPRSIALVNFVLRNRPATWPELLRRWNNEHPKEAYPDFRRIRTAYDRASTAILSPAYRPYTASRSADDASSRASSSDRR